MAQDDDTDQPSSSSLRRRLRRWSTDGALYNASRTRYTPGSRHALDSLDDLALQLIKAAPSCMEQRRTMYKQVRVLLFYWVDGEYEEMKANSEALGKLFHDIYHYEVVTVELPSTRPFFRLGEHLSKAAGDLGKNTLLIVYYCGHGAWNEQTRGKRLWSPNPRLGITLDWGKSQEYLVEAECDLLFLFDCCQSTAMLDDTISWPARCEVFGATDALDDALANEDHSFTRALVEMLASDDTTQGGTSIEELKWQLTKQKILKRHQLVRQPDHRKFSSPKCRSSVFLKPLVNTADQVPEFVIQRTVAQLNAISDKVMVLGLRIRKSATLFEVKNWLKWLSQAPLEIEGVDFRTLDFQQWSEVCSHVQPHAGFNGSLMIILSMPIWLWDYLEPNEAYRPIGVVEPGNLFSATLDPTIDVQSTKSRVSRTRSPSIHAQVTDDKDIGPREQRSNILINFYHAIFPANKVMVANSSQFANLVDRRAKHAAIPKPLQVSLKLTV